LKKHNSKKESGKMEPSWVSEKYADPIVRQFVHELNQLASAYSDRVFRDEGLTTLSLKHKGTRKKFIEYNPNKNRIFKTRDNLKTIGISEPLIEEYCKIIDKSGNPVSNIERVVAFQDKMIKEVK
jgi:hypothetical protein